MDFDKTLGLTNDQVHDLREAMRTVSMASDELKHGYRFDDEVAAQKLVYFERAIEILKEALRPILS